MILSEDSQRREGKLAQIAPANDDADSSTGKTINHAFAKELLAGFVGRLGETMSMDEYDAIRSKRHAE